jgi:hypothetical protein
VHNLKTLRYDGRKTLTLKLTRSSIVNAIKVVDAYITTRLIPHGDGEWTERTIITLIWLMTAETEVDSRHELSEFQESFDRIHKAWGSALSAEATHGALVVGAKFCLEILLIRAAFLETDRAFSSS